MTSDPLLSLFALFDPSLDQTTTVGNRHFLLGKYDKADLLLFAFAYLSEEYGEDADIDD